jgi:hypothetical protein
MGDIADRRRAACDAESDCGNPKMSVRALDIEFLLHPTHTRMPFRYGIAELRSVPHLIVRLTANVDGQVLQGVSADCLAPKWFTKNPATSAEDDQQEMLSIIRLAASLARELGEQPSVFAWWRALYKAQGEAAPAGTPPLLWNFGVSLIERAMLDAFCRRHRTTFGRALRGNAFGIDLGQIHPELAGTQPAEWLPPEPQRRIIARHTVGLSDPLRDADIPPAERLTDGLPQSLEATIAAYGLTHFKLKLCGDADRDLARLEDIGQLLDRQPNYAYTLDGNEQYHDVGSFRSFWQQLTSDKSMTQFLANLIFVEQPIHRDQALSDETAAALLLWPDRPPIIIDESDGDLTCLRRGLASGYVGTSHKNCKGVFKSIVNAALIEHHRRREPGKRFELSGEDLSNIGPVALLQDLAVAANLGLTHLERNGQHYFTGLNVWPRPLQEATFAAHPDLYEQSESGVIHLAIRDGLITVDSILAAPFGVQLPAEAFGHAAR